MRTRLVVTCLLLFGAALPAAADDPLLASWVPSGPQQSITPVPVAYVAAGLGVSNATQALAGVNDWINTDIWPVEMPSGLNTGRYIEVAIVPTTDRVVRVTRVRYASQSYGDSSGVLALATDANGFVPLVFAPSVGPGVRTVELVLEPPPVFDFGPGPRILRLYPYQNTAVLDWLDLVGANGGLRIEGRVALVRNVNPGQDRYSFTSDVIGGVEVPAAITHVQFVQAGTGVILQPFAATAPRTACLLVPLLDVAAPPDPASITGTGAPCGTIDPAVQPPATTLWKLATGQVYGLQVMQTVPFVIFRVRRLDDGLFANGFEG